MVEINTALNTVRDYLLSEHDGNGDNQLEIGAGKEAVANDIASSVIEELTSTELSGLGDIVEEEALTSDIVSAFAVDEDTGKSAADGDGDGFVSSAEIKSTLRELITVDVFQTGGQNKPIVLDGDIGDVTSSEMDGYFADEAHNTVWVQDAGGTKHQVYNSDKNYSFFEGGAAGPGSGQLPEYVIPKEDAAIGDLTGANPPAIHEVFYSQDGQLVYVGENSEVYELIESGQGYTIGEQLEITENGAVSGSGTDINNIIDAGEGSLGEDKLNGLEPPLTVSDDPVYIQSGDETFEVIVSGNNYHLTKLDDSGQPVTPAAEYVFARTVGIPEDNDIPVLGDDITDFEDLSAYEGDLIRTPDGQNLYVEGGEAYALANKDGGRINDNPVDISADGTIEGSLELIEGYQHTNTAEKIAWNINTGILGADRPKAWEISMSALHDEEDGEDLKTNLATSLKSIIYLGGENQATNLPSDDEIMAYVEGIDPNQTLEEWFDSINMDGGVLSAAEATYAVTGEASVTIPNRDVYSEVLQSDFDDLTINWSDESDSARYGTVEINNEVYLLRENDKGYAMYNEDILGVGAYVYFGSNE